jgi:hypothetical protein
MFANWEIPASFVHVSITGWFNSLATAMVTTDFTKNHENQSVFGRKINFLNLGKANG